MIKRVTAVVLLGLCSTGVAQASGAEFALGTDHAEFSYLTDSSSIGYGGADLGVSGLYNEDDDVMLTGHFLVSGSPGRDIPLQFGVGAKAYAADLGHSSDNVFAAGLGGQVRYLLPTQRNMAVSVEGYYAPDITSFGDADSFAEISPRFEVEVVPATRAFVGYRWMKAGIKHGSDHRLADEFEVGVRVSF